LKNTSNTHIQIPVDVLDGNKIKYLISEFMPDEIYHLAGQSSPIVSWESPAHTMRVNFEGTINVLNGVLDAKLNPAIVLASSSSIYAQDKHSSLITENCECSPSSPYGISKLAVDHLARNYHKAFNLKVFSARPFYLIGTQKVGDVCSDWARNIVDIENGKAKVLSIGEINGVIRDFLSIEEGVRGLTRIATHGKPGESYNICSGVGMLLSDVLSILINSTPIEIPIFIDETKRRPIEELVKVGDNSKLKDIGWNPIINIEQNLNDILGYWRCKYYGLI
jgi:GDP-4-dehydro-6-deoxy-D-mannose reductase